MYIEGLLIACVVCVVRRLIVAHEGRAGSPMYVCRLKYKVR